MIDSFQTVDAAFPWFFPTLVAVFGACLGSFLNVVIHRVPAGRSVVYPGSACACGRPIAWYDNIPVLSWFLLRGRARCCGARFSFRYPAVEILVAFLCWAAWIAHPPLVALVVILVIGLFVPASFIDLDTMEIPDVFSIGGFVLGLLLAALVPALHGFGEEPFLVGSMRSFLAALQGAFIGSGLILWFALIAETVLRKEAMGMGDVKLMGAIGAFFGWQGAVFALFGGAVIGTVVFLPLLWLLNIRSEGTGGVRQKGEDPAQQVPAAAIPGDSEEESEEAESAAGRIPFGPALAAGALLYGIAAHPWVDAYFAEFAAVLTGP